MILNYMNNRIRLNAFRSLNKSWKPTSSSSSLLHTSRSTLNADDETKKKTADSNSSDDQSTTEKLKTTNTSAASERKKQLLKKLGKFDFITLKTPDAPPPPSKTTSIKLKPQIDYQSFIKSKSQGSDASQTSPQPARDSSRFVKKPIKVEMDSRFERKNLANRRDETTKYSSKPSNDQEVALKVASLIDKVNPKETAKLLLDPLYKKEYDQEKEAKKKAAMEKDQIDLRF